MAIGFLDQDVLVDIAKAIRTAKTGKADGATFKGTAGMLAALQEIQYKTQEDCSVNNNGIHVPKGNYMSDMDFEVTAVDRANTTLSITGSSSQTYLDIKAVNDQPTGYTGGKKEATGKVYLTKSGDSVYARKGSSTGDIVAKQTIASGSATTPATTIPVVPSITINNGTIIASVDGGQDITPTVSAGYITQGTLGRISVSGSNNKVLTTKAGTTVVPYTTSIRSAVAANTYTLGEIKVGKMFDYDYSVAIYQTSRGNGSSTMNMGSDATYLLILGTVQYTSSSSTVDYITPMWIPRGDNFFYLPIHGLSYQLAVWGFWSGNTFRITNMGESLDKLSLSSSRSYYKVTLKIYAPSAQLTKLFSH